MTSKVNLLFQRILRKYRPYSGVRPDWKFLSDDQDWQFSKQSSVNGPRVLIATSTGSNWPCSGFESLLGVALTLRGASVSFLLCDGVLPACQECDHQWLSPEALAKNGPQSGLCASCFSPANSMLLPLGLKVLRYSDFLWDAGLTPSNENISTEHAFAGAVRYYGRGALPPGELSARIMARYTLASQMTQTVVRRLIAKVSPDVAIFHHGIYVPQGVIGEEMRGAGVRVVNWGPAYRKGTVYFSHKDSYHHTMIEEQPDQWADLAWTKERENTLMDYLRSRWTGGNDWISFQKDTECNHELIINQLSLDKNKPTIGLLTNVIWDAQLHFRQSAFPSMLEWVFCTIEYFISRPELQLVVRVHPAEIFGTVPSQQKVADEIYARFGALPAHIKIIGPNENVSTYALMALCDSVLVYGTKTALELACVGAQVVVAGEAWSRSKGFTIDVSSRDEYTAVLDRLPFGEKLSNQQMLMARQYAYHFFFRRMIPVKSLLSQSRFGPYKIKVMNINELKSGSDRGLDVICDGILSGQPFVYSA